MVTVWSCLTVATLRVIRFTHGFSLAKEANPFVCSFFFVDSLLFFVRSDSLSLSLYSWHFPSLRLIYLFSLYPTPLFVPVLELFDLPIFLFLCNSTSFGFHRFSPLNWTHRWKEKTFWLINILKGNDLWIWLEGRKVMSFLIDCWFSLISNQWPVLFGQQHNQRVLDDPCRHQWQRRRSWAKENQRKGSDINGGHIFHQRKSNG